MNQKIHKYESICSAAGPIDLSLIGQDLFLIKGKIESVFDGWRLLIMGREQDADYSLGFSSSHLSRIWARFQNAEFFRSVLREFGGSVDEGKTEKQLL